MNFLNNPLFLIITLVLAINIWFIFWMFNRDKKINALIKDKGYSLDASLTKFLQELIQQCRLYPNYCKTNLSFHKFSLIFTGSIEGYKFIYFDFRGLKPTLRRTHFFKGFATSQLIINLNSISPEFFLRNNTSFNIPHNPVYDYNDQTWIDLDFDVEMGSLENKYLFRSRNEKSIPKIKSLFTSDFIEYLMDPDFEESFEIHNHQLILMHYGFLKPDKIMDFIQKGVKIANHLSRSNQ